MKHQDFKLDRSEWEEKAFVIYCSNKKLTSMLWPSQTFFYINQLN